MEKRGVMGVGALAGLALLVSGGGWVYSRSGASSDLKIDSPLAVTATPGAKGTPAPPTEFRAGENAPAASPALPSPTPEPTPTAIMVHVAGRVKNPGLYEMKPGDRIKKAIDAAGGFLPDADMDALNLADYVRDADKYFVGKKSETPAAVPVVTAITHSDRAPAAAVAAKLPAPGRVLGSKVPVAAAKAAGGGGGETHPAKFKNPGDGVINLNTADLAELQRLPGVGPSTAEKILEHRKTVGPFADISQLKDVS